MLRKLPLHYPLLFSADHRLHKRGPDPSTESNTLHWTLHKRGVELYACPSSTHNGPVENDEECNSTKHSKIVGSGSLVFSASSVGSLLPDPCTLSPSSICTSLWPASFSCTPVSIRSATGSSSVSFEGVVSCGGCMVPGFSINTPRGVYLVSRVFGSLKWVQINAPGRSFGKAFQINAPYRKHLKSMC